MNGIDLDQDRLSELASEIGADDLRLVLDMFLAEARDAVAALRDDLAAGDYAKSMHFLRSGALNLGLSGLAEEARRVAHVPDAERLASVVGPELQRAIDASRAALTKRLDA